MAMYLFNEFDPALRAGRILDQRFGRGFSPEDLLSPFNALPYQPLLPRNYYRPWRVDTADAGSTVHNDKDNFQVTLDVQQFSPEEIQVKVADGHVVVEGKHEEKQDEHGFISRQFTRRYLLPKGCRMENVSSTLSSDGVLSIKAPKTPAVEGQEKRISITHTGPHKAIQGGDKK